MRPGSGESGWYDVAPKARVPEAENHKRENGEDRIMTALVPCGATGQRNVGHYWGRPTPVNNVPSPKPFLCYVLHRRPSQGEKPAKKGEDPMKESTLSKITASVAVAKGMAQRALVPRHSDYD